MNTNFFANEGSLEVEIYEGSKKTFTEQEEQSLENFCVMPQKTKNSERKAQKQPEKELSVQKPVQNEDIIIFESKHKPLFKINSDSDAELGTELDALDNQDQRVAPAQVEPEYRVTLDSPGQQQRSQDDVVQAVVNKYAQYEHEPQINHAHYSREPRKTWEPIHPNQELLTLQAALKQIDELNQSQKNLQDQITSLKTANHSLAQRVLYLEQHLTHVLP